MPPSHPEVMAIGDSIYNGVRSLTINAALAANSPPALVARAFDWPFVTPDYPFDMLADLEAIFRHPASGTLGFARSAAANAHGWLASPRWSAAPLFHNLSIAQQTVSDIWTANYKSAIKTASDLAVSGAALPIAKFPALYQALNTAFVLNPTRVPDDPRTAIDILAAEQPKRVLINIGVNNGLFTILLMADSTDYAHRMNPIADMRTLALHLKEACPHTQHFYINLFPKPSSIANLMAPWTGDPAPIPNAGYYDRYIGHLLGNGGISRARMRELDDWVRTDLNPRVQNAYAPLGDRARFVDLYASSSMYDRKNLTNTKEVLVRKNGTQILLDNRAIDVMPLFGGLGGFGGGLFGLDNLHPTIVGYGLIAQAVCEVIAQTENVPVPIVDLQACYDADTLLHNLPATIGLADFAIEFLGTFFGTMSQSPTV